MACIYLDGIVNGYRRRSRSNGKAGMANRFGGLPSKQGPLWAEKDAIPNLFDSVAPDYGKSPPFAHMTLDLRHRLNRSRIVGRCLNWLNPAILMGKIKLTPEVNLFLI
jgi:hypothetical protein